MCVSVLVYICVSVCICVFPGAFTDKGQRRNPAFVLLFAVFDETKSWYGEVGERKSREKFKRSDSRKEYHTINGYINSTLPGNDPEFASRRHVSVLLTALLLYALYTGM